MTKAELTKFKAEIETELGAVNTLLARFDDPAMIRGKTIAGGFAAVTKRPSRLAEEIIMATIRDFTVSDIAVMMGQALGRKPERYGDNARQAIHKLRQRNPPEVEVVSGKEGVGSRSGTYRYIRK